MDVIKQAQAWAHGDALQGKIMLAIGIVMLVAEIFIIKGDNSLLKGMLIPMSLFVLIAVGYGGFLSFTRHAHFEKAEIGFKENLAATQTAELKKAEQDHKNYTVAKKVWPWLIIAAALLAFFVMSEYWKGLSLGFMGLFLFVWIIDSLLHQRLEPYLNSLTQLNAIP